MLISRNEQLRMKVTLGWSLLFPIKSCSGEQPLRVLLSNVFIPLQKKKKEKKENSSQQINLSSNLENYFSRVKVTLR